MLRVYLLRHGETAYNADGNRYCGRTDIGLTEKGIDQANLAHRSLQGVHLDAVYASPLQRAVRTAELASGRKDVQTDERLIEIDFGSWEGKTREEFVAEDPLLWDRWIQDPYHARAGGTGEWGHEIVKRVDLFFTEKLEKHEGQTILVVGHNGINRLYMAYKLGMELRHYRRLVQENSSVTLFELDASDGFSLLKLNAVAF